MKKILMVLVLLAIAVTAFAQNADGNTLYKGWQAYQRCQKTPTTVTKDDREWSGWYKGYVQATVEVLIDLEKIQVPDNTNWEIGFNVVGKFLEKNPSRWEEFAAVFIFQAFIETFGYPENNQKSSITEPNA
jgi:hypothetical protein